MDEQADLVIIGAGAAGLMAGIWAGRTHPPARIVILDGAKSLGAKILVAGGGRCNVTHEQVSENDYAGASRNAIKKVLRRFDVPPTMEFFRELGVMLKREPTGKLFPTTDSARTVLEALLRGVQQAGVGLRYPCRVETLTKTDSGFRVGGAWGTIHAKRVILATGGRSLPKSGSDGFGYQLVQGLGHTLTPRIFPALVPLILPDGHWLRELSGISADVTLTLQQGGKRLAQFTNALLCTHFGLSGPAVLDISRYVVEAPQAQLTVNWLPTKTPEQVETELQQSRETIGRYVGHLPERLGRGLCAAAEIAATTRSDQLTREQRRRFVTMLTAMPLSITGNRGYTYAEVTAGGVPLEQLHLKTMQSRVCEGLFLCGEICDVDGRIGGFNFQWAWSSGYVAGVSALGAE